jgi:hypothetical protein
MTSAFLTRALIVAALLFTGFIIVRDQMRHHPERLPWTPLTLQQPIGPFTARKLQALADDPAQCRALLTAAQAGFTPLPPVKGDSCGYSGAVTLKPEAPAAGWRPAEPGASCPVAAALYLWERDIVRPAALRHFKKPIAAIDHFGTYSCRRINNRPSGDWSEHARANAIDIAGFRLEGGTQVRVLGDWNGDPAKAAFLREVRDGACRLFGTTLSPDYNAAHADHLHLDQAARGGSYCR